MLYALLYGQPPFATSHVKATYKRIKAVSFCFPDDVPVSDEAKQLITSILR